MGKIDRIGEERVNNFGSKMVIKEYRKYKDIDVYFPEYNWIFKHARYDTFKKGNIKCPYEPRLYGVGYIGEGEYDYKNNKRCYQTWQQMLVRCYDPKFYEKNSTYRNCLVCEEWLNYQNFAKWYYDNYYEIPNEIINLDKDILYKGNKLYSPETCIFVPQKINDLFVKNNVRRNKLPMNIIPNKNKYVVYCNNYNKRNYIGSYKTIEEAFQAHKNYKENIIKERIDNYEGIIPEPHYSKLKEAMYNYKVEITD